jgi:hypothetical protein
LKLVKQGAMCLPGQTENETVGCVQMGQGEALENLDHYGISDGLGHA